MCVCVCVRLVGGGGGCARVCVFGCACVRACERVLMTYCNVVMSHI